MAVIITNLQLTIIWFYFEQFKTQIILIITVNAYNQFLKYLRYYNVPEPDTAVWVIRYLHPYTYN